MSMKTMCLQALCIFSLAAVVQAADIRDTLCRTTEECQAEANKLRGVSANDATSARAKTHDQFYWIGRINMATTVMTVEEGVVPQQYARQIAEGVSHSIAQAAQPKRLAISMAHRHVCLPISSKRLPVSASPGMQMLHLIRWRTQKCAPHYKAPALNCWSDFS